MRVVRRLLVGVVATSALTLNGAAPSDAAPVANTCGGALQDYIGTGGLDVPFTGTAHASDDRPMTVAPLFLNSSEVKVEISAGSNESRYAIGPLHLRVDPTGRGQISFDSYAGDGWSTNISCAVGTRVTAITGRVFVDDLDSSIDFTVRRT
ncbi:hypothetical protein [Kitasatospora purpeofusca]|uniref:hypothetical protein n=1 Tax=Kitasatospora purpeofusca TaxID=67352 RepID=UPI0012FECE9D|nr:hypothetical protein [Kitasatospora purpeofusca]